MKLLLIEDDENKRAKLADFLAREFGGWEVVAASSLITGLRAVVREQPDIVILDMTLPNYEVTTEDGGGQMHIFGGREFLRQLKRRQLASRVVVVTQFETFGKPPNTMNLAELAESLSDEFPEQYLRTIYYHASIDTWERELASELRGVPL